MIRPKGRLVFPALRRPAPRWKHTAEQRKRHPFELMGDSPTLIWLLSLPQRNPWQEIMESAPVWVDFETYSRADFSSTRYRK